MAENFFPLIHIYIYSNYIRKVGRRGEEGGSFTKYMNKNSDVVLQKI